MTKPKVTKEMIDNLKDYKKAEIIDVEIEETSDVSDDVKIDHKNDNGNDYLDESEFDDSDDDEIDDNDDSDDDDLDDNQFVEFCNLLEKRGYNIYIYSLKKPDNVRKERTTKLGRIPSGVNANKFCRLKSLSKHNKLVFIFYSRDNKEIRRFQFAWKDLVEFMDDFGSIQSSFDEIKLEDEKPQQQQPIPQTTIQPVQQSTSIHELLAIQKSLLETMAIQREMASQDTRREYKALTFGFKKGFKLADRAYREIDRIKEQIAVDIHTKSKWELGADVLKSAFESNNLFDFLGKVISGNSTKKKTNNIINLQDIREGS